MLCISINWILLLLNFIILTRNFDWPSYKNDLYFKVTRNIQFDLDLEDQGQDYSRSRKVNLKEETFMSLNEQAERNS